MVWDDRMFELYGIKKDDSPNTFDAWANGLHPEDKLRAFDECNEALNGGKNYNTEFRVLHPDGNVLYLKADAIIIRNQNGEAIRMIGLNKDITQAKKAEKNIRKLNRVYALLSSTDQAIVRVHNRQQLLDEACRIAVEDGGFQMTWIGLLNPETNKLDVVASAGKVGDYLKNVNIDFNIAERCSGPTGQAIIHGKSVFTSNIETDDLMKPWKEAAVENAYRSSISLPLTIAGKVIGAYTMYSSEADFFDTDEVTLLDGMASDISFALEFIENEIERKLAEDELQFTLSQLRQLHNHIESLIEKEKTAISRELHDGLGQMLTAILMDISFIKNDVTNPNALLKIQSVINLIKDTIKCFLINS